MKCGACGYEHKPDKVIEEPVFYLRGQKKGELKKMEKSTVTYTKFKEIEVQEGALRFTSMGDENRSWNRNETVYLYACPECGTVRME